MRSYLKLMTLGLASFTMSSEVWGTLGNGWLGANEADPSWKGKLERALIKSNGMLPNLCVMELTGDAGLGVGHLPGGAALARFSDQIRSNHNGDFYVVTRPSGQNVAWGGAAQYMVAVNSHQRRNVKNFPALYPGGITAAVLNNLNNAPANSREILRNPNYYQSIINQIALYTNRPVGYLVIDPGTVWNRIDGNIFSDYFSRYYLIERHHVFSDLDCSGRMTFGDGNIFTAIGKDLRVGGQVGAKKLKLLQMGQHPNQANGSSHEILINQNGVNLPDALFIVADIRNDKVYLIFEEGRRGRATQRANQVQVGSRNYACPSWLGKFLAISVIGGVTAWYCLNTKAHAWDTANGYGITKFNFPKIPDGFTGKVVRVTLPPAENFTFTQSGNQTLEFPQHYSLLDTANVQRQLYFINEYQGDGNGSVLVTKKDFDEMRAFCSSQNPLLGIPWLGKLLRPMFCIPAGSVETFNLHNNSTTANLPTQPRLCTDEDLDSTGIGCIPSDFNEVSSILKPGSYTTGWDPENVPISVCRESPDGQFYTMHINGETMRYLLSQDPQWEHFMKPGPVFGTYQIKTSLDNVERLRNYCRGYSDPMNGSVRGKQDRCFPLEGVRHDSCPSRVFDSTVNLQESNSQEFLPTRQRDSIIKLLETDITTDPAQTPEQSEGICPDGSCPEIVQNSINLGIKVAEKGISAGRKIKERFFQRTGK